MRKHLVLATVMAVVVGLLLAACGSEPTPTPRPTATPRPEAMPAPTAMMLPTPTLRPGQPTPTPTPVPPGVTVVPTPTAAAAVPTPTLDASFTAEWERLIVAAQEEGKLVIAGGGGVQSIAPIYKFFEDEFGVKVVLGRGSSTEHANRILAEQAAGRFTVDVAHSGANSANVRYIGNGMAQEIAPWIFHPEAGAGELVRGPLVVDGRGIEVPPGDDVKHIVGLRRRLLVEHQQHFSGRGGVLDDLARRARRRPDR